MSNQVPFTPESAISFMQADKGRIEGNIANAIKKHSGHKTISVGPICLRDLDTFKREYTSAEAVLRRKIVEEGASHALVSSRRREGDLSDFADLEAVIVIPASETLALLRAELNDVRRESIALTQANQQEISMLRSHLQEAKRLNEQLTKERLEARNERNAMMIEREEAKADLVSADEDMAEVKAAITDSLPAIESLLRHEYGHGELDVDDDEEWYPVLRKFANVSQEEKDLAAAQERIDNPPPMIDKTCKECGATFQTGCADITLCDNCLPF